MTAVAELIHRQTATAQLALHKAATPMTSSSSGTSGTGSAASTSNSASSSATISANDFLTLLVTEMQNQDPTANTDPNEYINQLVQVNSLEQLININQTLTTDLGSASTTSSTSGAGASTQATPATSSSVRTATASSSAPSAHTAVHSVGAPVSTALHAANSAPVALPMRPESRIAGNLSVPQASPAADRVAQALAGRIQSPLSQRTSLPNR